MSVISIIAYPSIANWWYIEILPNPTVNNVYTMAGWLPADTWQYKFFVVPDHMWELYTIYWMPLVPWPCVVAINYAIGIYEWVAYL